MNNLGLSGLETLERIIHTTCPDWDFQMINWRIFEHFLLCTKCLRSRNAAQQVRHPPYRRWNLHLCKALQPSSKKSACYDTDMVWSHLFSGKTSDCIMSSGFTGYVHSLAAVVWGWRKKAIFTVIKPQPSSNINQNAFIALTLSH